MFSCCVAVAGAFVSGNSSVQAQAPQYVVTDLGTLGGANSYGYGVNIIGDVTGYSELAGNNDYHAFLYSGGSMQDLGTLGGAGSVGNGVNNAGQVTGYSYLSGDRAPYRAFVASGGSMQDLGALGGTYSYGTQINNSAQVTGYAYISANSAYHAFLYSGGSMQDLGTLGGGFASGNGINNSGQVTGYCYISGNTAAHAFLYSDGSMQDLGTLGGTYSYGNGINSSGQVAGYSYASGSNAAHAFLYSNGSIVDLGTLGGLNSYGNSVNDSGQVSGVSSISGDVALYPFLYSGGILYKLDTLVPASADLTGLDTSSAGSDLNARGQIAAEGKVASGQIHALLLTPRSMGTQFSGGLGDVFGGAINSIAYGVSNNGSLVGGMATNGLNQTSFKWTLNSEIVDMADNTQNIGSQANAVSADGTALAGSAAINNQSTAYLNSTTLGYELLPFLPGDTFAFATATSSDGSFVVGYSYGSDPQAGHGFIWNNNQLNDLGALRSGTSSTRAFGISGDGSVVVGFSQSDRTIGTNTEGFRWVSGTMTGLGDLTGSTTSVNSAAYAVSQNGNVVVGQSDSVVGPQAFRWTLAGGMIGLGNIAGESGPSTAYSTSNDGRVVVGTGTAAGINTAMVWDQAHGTRSLQTVLLTEYGVGFAGWHLSEAKAISSDAKAVVGYGHDPLGNTQAFNAQINSRTYRFMSGENYHTFHTSHLGGLGTSVDLLDGTAGGASATFRTVTVDTQTNTPATNSPSDIAAINGTSGDTYVVQLSYDEPTAVNLFGNDQCLVLGWFNGTTWVNALDGNNSGSPTFISGGYDGDLTLGHCGLDTTNHVAWAVVNHGGQFAVLGHVSPLTTFAKWQQAYFNAQELGDPSVSGDAADPNKNGLPNLLEYAFNLNPTASSTANRPSAAIDSTYFSLIYTKVLGATDLTYSVEQSTDLVQWSAASPINEILSDNCVTQLIKAKVAIGSANKLFLKLRVSR